jgi:hypothetical protein
MFPGDRFFCLAHQDVAATKITGPAAGYVWQPPRTQDLHRNGALPHRALVRGQPARILFAPPNLLFLNKRNNFE